MIAYTIVGTNNIEKAAAFYDELLSLAGAQRAIDAPRMIAWGNNPAAPMFAIATPYDEKPATVGNGSMVAIAATDPDQVNAFYAKALELGGTTEGEPGVRMDAYYCAYVRDLDGNKLNFFCMAK
ncbi:MAG: VOC family protein [Pseudomonadota bacterium]|nr:glyoxalase [Alteromonas sp.]MEC9262704.1 VOC family protein [Pseudomonadota bacterium]HCA77845.1 glyoxalase [Alteromonas sp.]HCB17761.1 glyoxalase [Alteromonas sp.]HCV18917.1 glyoxalase [Alteromonas sp.]